MKSPITKARLRPIIEPSFPPVTISIAMISVYSTIALWMPVTVVSRSFATVAIETFITELSSAIRNWPAHSVSSTTPPAAPASSAVDVRVSIAPSLMRHPPVGKARSLPAAPRGRAVAGGSVGILWDDSVMTTPGSFSPEVSAKLATYVYRLIDPRNGETFYVGKGRGNRVFAHIRAEESISGDELDNKLARIREIRLSGLEVGHVIHRHGMDDATAFEVEAALMDAYPGLTNIAG